MKKIILGTLAAAAVIASANVASAQTRMERNWFDLSALSSHNGPNAMDPNKNFAPDSVR